MMDYQEEQLNELEALESIYYGDFEIISREPVCKFLINIRTENYECGDGLACNLQFEYTVKYPDEAPLIDIEESDDFPEEYRDKLLLHLNEQIGENIGTVMIFTLVTAAQEWLNLKWEISEKQKKDILLQKQREEEELEMKKFEGTEVTVESFMNWKLKFEDEFGIAKKREAMEREGKKLTGRELFMTDKTLNESDLKFLEADDVKVDESLFQDLDDLDLDDEDDPDYDPNNSGSNED